MLQSVTQRQRREGKEGEEREQEERERGERDEREVLWMWGRMRRCFDAILRILLSYLLCQLNPNPLRQRKEN
jgi:hypothetical protein